MKGRYTGNKSSFEPPARTCWLYHACRQARYESLSAYERTPGTRSKWRSRWNAMLPQSPLPIPHEASQQDCFFVLFCFVFLDGLGCWKTERKKKREEREKPCSGHVLLSRARIGRAETFFFLLQSTRRRCACYFPSVLLEQRTGPSCNGIPQYRSEDSETGRSSGSDRLARRCRKLPHFGVAKKLMPALDEAPISTGLTWTPGTAPAKLNATSTKTSFIGNSACCSRNRERKKEREASDGSNSVSVFFLFEVVTTETKRQGRLRKKKKTSRRKKKRPKLAPERATGTTAFQFFLNEM